MNTSVNELLSNPAFRPLVLLDVLAVFLMIICLVFRRMRKGYYVEQANDARKATMLNIAVRNVTGMGVYSAPGYWDNGDLNLCRFERANGDIVPGAVEADGEGGLRVYEINRRLTPVRLQLPAPGRGGIQGDLEEADQEEVLTWEGRGNC